MATQDKYTKSARGKPCQIRVPGVCRPAPDNETTVPCHLNGAGMGRKHSNIHIAYGCAACHDFVDGGWTRTDYSKDEVDLLLLQGLIRTQIIMIEEGIFRL